MATGTKKVRMNYRLSGKDAAPVVVLSHSLACSMIMWSPQLEALESRFRVLRFDTRGHGGSEAPIGPYSLDDLVGDAVGLLDDLHINTVHWVGLSMGGMIGQGLVLTHPERVESLVLADTAAVVGDDAQHVWQERIDSVRSGGMQAVAESTLQRWFTPGYHRRNPEGVARVRRQILATPTDGYIGCSEAIRRIRYLDQLSTIRVPVLIMVGADDPGTPVAASQAMHARIERSTLVVISDAAHLSNIEQPKTFNANLMGHLDQSAA